MDTHGIALVTPDGATRRQLVPVDGEVGQLAWSPDSASIAFTAWRPPPSD